MEPLSLVGQSFTRKARGTVQSRWQIYRPSIVEINMLSGGIAGTSLCFQILALGTQHWATRVSSCQNYEVRRYRIYDQYQGLTTVCNMRLPVQLKRVEYRQHNDGWLHPSLGVSIRPFASRRFLSKLIRTRTLLRSLRISTKRTQRAISSSPFKSSNLPSSSDRLKPASRAREKRHHEEIE